MRGDSVEVTFAGEILGASREDVFRAVRTVAEGYERHRVVPAGESALVVRHQDPARWWWFLVSWWTLLFDGRDDTFVVTTRPTPNGTHVDVVGTGVSRVVDEVGDALDTLSAGGLR